MIVTLLIIIVVLVIALWISTMALWRQHEAGTAAKTIGKREVVKALQKAERLARRSAYSSLRYGKQAAAWSEKKAEKALVAVFPKAKSAFTTQDPLTGLEHGPSSYFLASISKPTKKSKKKKLSE